jgi:hypothetical protein
MTHEKMMEKAWRFIADMRISENREEEADYYVENIHQVRDAYYADIESGHDFVGESLEGFFTRHGIKWDD